MLKNIHEFRVGRGCPAAIQHLRNRIAPKTPDSFAAWTRAENGRLKALAGLFFPGVVDVSSRNSACARDFARTLIASGTPVAGMHFKNGTISCKVDFAVVTGTTLRIYEVLPKCIDLDQYRNGLAFATTQGRIRAEWRDHFQSIALKAWVLQKQTGLTYDRVIPFLILPIHGVVSKIESLHSQFVHASGAWKLKPEGALISAADFLRQVCVEKECAELIPLVACQAAALDAEVATAKPKRCYACKNCDVLEACWGPLAQVKPHLFSLGYLWFAKDKSGRSIAETQIRANRMSLLEIDAEEITGDYSQRQRMQLHCERTGKEVILPGLKTELEKIKYPVIGLDIETIRSLTPCHRGSRVQGLDIFQFSSTRQVHPGAPLTYHDWLNTAPENPNREFLVELRKALGDAGSVLVYTQYEESCFRELLLERISAGDDSADVIWLKGLLDRLVDLHRILFENFCAPGFGGKTSIKRVLPALWAVDSPIKRQAPFNEFPTNQDPYAYLKSIGAVTDGIGAMENYIAMQGAKGAEREALASSLKQYVRVDAISMNFVLEFFRRRVAEADATHATRPLIAA